METQMIFFWLMSGFWFVMMVSNVVAMLKNGSKWFGIFAVCTAAFTIVAMTGYFVTRP